MLDKRNLIIIRPAVAEDKNFILATWLRGLYYGAPMYQDIPKDIFMANYHAFLTRLISQPTEIINVACLKDDPDTILGYAAYKSAGGINVLDYVFVKSAWRRIGIGKSLVPMPIHVVTHLTKVGKSLMTKEIVYNPFLIG